MNENLKVNFTHVCQTAFFSEDKKLNIIGIFDGIKAQKLPVTYSEFSIVFNVSGDINQDGYIKIESPSGEKILDLGIDSSKIDKNKESNNIIINVLGLRLESKGQYRVYLEIDGHVIGEKSKLFNVVE